MFKKILVAVLIAGAAIAASPRTNTKAADLLGISIKESPNGPQTVVVTFRAPAAPVGDSIRQLFLGVYTDGVFTNGYYYTNKLPNEIVTTQFVVSGPDPGKTKSYVFQIHTLLVSGKPVRARSFFWQRTNTSVHLATPDSVAVGVRIRWSNPITAGVLGDSFRVWRKEYFLPDTVGTDLIYDGTIFPGDTLFRARNKVAKGRLYKYYGSLYLFGAERVRYPFVSIIVR